MLRSCILLTLWPCAGSPPKALHRGVHFPPSKPKGAPSAPGSAPSPLDNPQPKRAASLTSSKPLGERQEATSHLLQPHFPAMGQRNIPPAALVLPAASLPPSWRHSREEKQLLFSQRCLCCRRWQRQRWLCKRGLLAPVLGGHRLWHSLFPRKGGQGMPKSAFWEQKDYEIANFCPQRVSIWSWFGERGATWPSCITGLWD